MAAEVFAAIYHRAAERKGGEGRLESMLSSPSSQQELADITDDRYLSAFTKKVFQSGFVWRVVENKWPNFERLFSISTSKKYCCYRMSCLNKKPKILTSSAI